MKYKVGDIVSFEQVQEATDYVNSIDGGYYLEDYSPDENGRMRLAVRKIPAPTPEEQAAALQKHYTDLIQRLLDAEAQKLGYDNCNSVCTYVDTGVAKFDAEGMAFRKWRSAVWAMGYELLAEVQAGTRPVPTEEELVELLPQLEIVYEG